MSYSNHTKKDLYSPPKCTGANLDQRAGGADEHGGEVEAEDGLRPCRRGQPGRDREVGSRYIFIILQDQKLKCSVLVTLIKH